MTAAGTERARVLVVDDEPAVARAARRLLAPAYDVEVAHSAAEALSFLDGDGAVQAIVCDLLMPGVTGMALYRQVKARRPELAGCFVFVTGGAFTPEAQEFLSTAGRRWVEKPFDPALLLEAVRGITEGAGRRTP